MEERKRSRIWFGSGVVNHRDEMEELLEQYAKEACDYGHARVIVGSALSFRDCARLEDAFDFVIRLEDQTPEKLNLLFWYNVTFGQAFMDKGESDGGEITSLFCVGRAHQHTFGNIKQNEANLHRDNEAIAIVGLSCRLPGANDCSTFWSNLIEGKNSIGPPPAGRWRLDQGCDNLTLEHAVTQAGFLSCPVDTFDSEFWGLSPLELEYTDPQARMLLQLAWEALENAGIPPTSLHGSNSSIFVGLWRDEYKDLLLQSCSRAGDDELRRYLGCSMGNAAARIAHMLGTTGPALATETGCSSSMISIGLAMEALRNGQTQIALAGGANLILKPFLYDNFQGVLSPVGQCKTFQDDADGFARAEGSVLFVLKKLSDAIDNGDHIYGLLRGFGSAQEGLSRSVGTPTVEGEARAMSNALKNAGLSPSAVDWVEIHGTGTKVGDPIEVAATNKAYAVEDRTRPLLLTSVKANIGHTESVSGGAGLLKVLLALENGAIPPQRLTGPLNSKLQLDGFQIPNELHPWNGNLAGISSFGITGTNAHLIVERAPMRMRSTSGCNMSVYILPVSAKCLSAMKELKARHAQALKNVNDSELGNYCYTAATCRDHFQAHRSAIVASSREEMIESLLQQDTIETKLSKSDNCLPKLCFLFPGQGCQYTGMGKELYQTCATFRRHFDLVDALLTKKYEISLKTVMLEGTSISLYSHLYIFGVEYSLLKLWVSWGIIPSFVLGHSFGEFAASVAAGALCLPVALELLVELRIEMLARVEPGAMLVLKADEAMTNQLITKFLEKTVSEATLWVDIAAVNSSEQTVISALPDTIDRFSVFCKEEGIKVTKVDVTYAFHSRALDPIGAEYEEKAGKICHSKRFPEIGYISSVDGKMLDEDDVQDASYWFRHMRQRVEFMQAAKTALDVGKGMIFIEVGPHPILSSLLSNMAGPGEEHLFVPSMRKGNLEMKTMFEAVASLYVNGMELDWDRVWKSFGNFDKIPKLLPVYPFQAKDVFWFTPEVGCGLENNRSINLVHPLLGRKLNTPLSTTHLFTTSTGALLQREGKWLRDHKLGPHIIFPAAAYAEMAWAAVAAVAKYRRGVQLNKFQIKLALPLEVDSELQTLLEESGSGFKVSIYSRKGDEAEWKLHATTLVTLLEDNNSVNSDHSLMEEYNSLMQEDTVSLYDEMQNLGYNFGPSFKTLRNIARRDDGSFCCEVFSVMESSGYFIHPTIIDAMIQGVLLDEPLTSLKLPTGIGSLKLNRFRNTDIPLRVTVTKAGAKLMGLAENGFWTEIGSLSTLTTVSTSLGGVFEGAVGLKVETTKLLPLFVEEWIETESIGGEGIGMGVMIEKSTAARPSNWIIVADITASFSKKLEHYLTPALATLFDFNVQLGNERFHDVDQIVFLVPDDNLNQYDNYDKDKIWPTLASFLRLSQSLKKATTLHLVSHGVAAIKDEEANFPLAAPLIGLSRTLANECPQVEVHWVDLDPLDDENVRMAQLGTELRTALKKERCVSYRGGIRYLGKLVPFQTRDILPFPEGSVQLRLPKSRCVADVEWEPVSGEKLLGPNEIGVRLLASGLNFKDLFNIMKPTSEFFNAVGVGADFSGEVVSLGSAVNGWTLGDLVIGMNPVPAPLPNHIMVDADFVISLPPTMTHTEGACFPTAFVTAYHCLVDVGHLSAGQTVLIHTASGGVGLAAIQVARGVGATVVCTAGSRRKRAYLQLQGLANVYSSRDLSFVQGVMAATDGFGVDLVLNSLTSKGFKEASLSVTRPGGCFVEMSKLNIWTKAEVAEMRPDVNYSVEDLGISNKSRLRHLMVQLGSWLADGRLTSIRHTVFEPEHIASALGQMERALHVGKLVVRWSPNLFNDRSTYLITGGTGGIGLEVARWMLMSGAKHIVLVSRRNIGADFALAKLKEEQIDISGVIVKAANIGDQAQVTHLLKEITKQLPPIRGVIHAAGVTSDATLAHQNMLKMEEVFEGKVGGAWALHFATQHLAMEHFVLFSSAMGFVGGPGQANYSAANASLAALAEHRHRLGLPVTCIAWGLWGGTGMATSLNNRLVFGAQSFSTERGIKTLSHLIRNSDARNVMAAEVNKDVTLGWLRDYLVQESGIISEETAIGPENETTIDNKVRNILAKILRIRGALNGRSELRALGMDSLMYIELNNKLLTEMGLTLEIADSITLDELVQLVTDAKAIPTNLT